MNNVKKSIIYSLISAMLIGCNGQFLDTLEESGENDFCPGLRLSDGKCPLGSGSLTKGIWSFSVADNYTFNSNYVEISSGTATLKSVNQFYNGSSFDDGTHAGSYVNSDNNLSIKLKSDSSFKVSSILPNKVSSLIGYWRMDGSENDETGNIATTIQGGTTFSTHSRVGDQSLILDGVDDYLDITTGTSRAYTISMWVNYSDLTTVKALMDGSGDSWLDIYLNGTGHPYLWSRDTSLTQTKITSSISLVENVWSHIAIVLGPSGRKIYVDGVLGAQDTIHIADTVIGRIGSVGSYFGKGFMDEVAIWNSELEEVDIIKIYNKQSLDFTNLNSTWTPKYSNIVGHWKLDGDFKDSSGNGYDGVPYAVSSFSNNAKVGSKSVLFDGSGGSFRLDTNIKDKFNPAKGTISCWIYNQNDDFSSVSNRFALRAYYTGGNNDGLYFRFYDTGKFQFNYSGNSSLAGVTVNDFSEEIPLDKWTHVTATWDITDTQKLKLYLNGVLKGEATQNQLIAGTFSFFDFGYGNVTAHKGGLDDCAIWSTNLDQSDVSTIYHQQKQEYSAHYDSPVIDLGTSGSWSNLSAITPLPFMKELSSTSENISDYSAINGDLSNGLIGYWPLNESSLNNAPGGNDFKDYSGHSAHAVESGGVGLGKTLTLGKAAQFDGIDDYLIIPNASAPNPNDNISVSLWLQYDNLVQDDFASVIGKGSGTPSWYIMRNNLSKKVNIRFHTSAIFNQVHTSTLDVFDGELHHIYFTANSGSASFYVDGKLDSSWSYSHGTGFGSSNDLKIAGNGSFFSGVIDEVAIWDRSLTVSEISELYRRGGNRLKYQVRSCDDIVCDTESFLGPDGTAGTYFSEFHNNTTINGSGEPTGDVKTSSPNFILSDFVSAPSNNRYFQYRVYMESDDENNLCSGLPCMPEVESIEVGPTGRYFGGTPSVTANNGIVYNKINKISFSESGSCEIGYQFSNDGSIYYFWNGVIWASVSSDLDRNNKVVAANNIQSFSTQFGPGTLYFKSFSPSDTSQSCELREVSIENV